MFNRIREAPDPTHDQIVALLGVLGMVGAVGAEFRLRKTTRVKGIAAQA